MPKIACCILYDGESNQNIKARYCVSVTGVKYGHKYVSNFKNEGIKKLMSFFNSVSMLG